jgi:hypothetical protein
VFFKDRKEKKRKEKKRKEKKRKEKKRKEKKRKEKKNKQFCKKMIPTWMMFDKNASLPSISIAQKNKSKKQFILSEISYTTYMGNIRSQYVFLASSTNFPLHKII